MHNKLKYNIAVIGLGYVGFPLLVELEKTCNSVIGFDISQSKIDRRNKETDNYYILTNKKEDLYNKDVYIVCVPTPIDNNNTPDLSNITDVTNMLAEILDYNVKNYPEALNIVCYESSVAPTTINIICKEIIEIRDSLFNNNGIKNYVLAHAPERMSPADNEHTVNRVCKIVACEDANSLNILKKIYYSIMQTEWGGDVITTTSIEAAEATKMLENIQRDVNIALMNEYTVLMNKLHIDMNEVLRLARTRWNFCDFTPGLVGGHCVAVDPYYITDLDNENTKIIQLAREINDNVPAYIVKKFNELVKEYSIDNVKIGILGFSFKENSDDIRNTRVFDIYKNLSKYYETYIIDDLVDKNNAKDVYNLEINNVTDFKNSLNCLIIAVPHTKYRHNIQLILDNILQKHDNEDFNIRNIIIDIKGICNNVDIPDNTVIWAYS